jgi:dihydrofolate reductase
MATTANGMIAMLNHETPWSSTVWKNYHQIVKKYGSIIVGRKTYELMKDANEFKKIGNPTTVIVTTRPSTSTKNFIFVKTPREALNELKKRGFKKTLLGGGAMVNTAFMKQKLVDEIHIDIEPMIFGTGIPLFAPEAFTNKLKLRSIEKLSKNTVQLQYAVQYDK